MHPSSDLADLKVRCATTTSLAELLQIALSELRKFTDPDNPPEVVCGPVSTGGRGNVAENIRALDAVVTCLTHRGRPIFNQVPYEDKIFELRTKWQSKRGNKTKYYTPILDEFYQPLFETGAVRRAFFLPGSDSSLGAVWEREKLMLLDADIVDLTYEWVSTIIDNPTVDRFKPLEDFWAEHRESISNLFPGRYVAIVGETMERFYGKDYNDVRRHFPPLLPWGLTVLGVTTPPKP